MSGPKRELTEDDIADLKECFAMLDVKKGNGRIDNHQLRRAMRKLGQNPSDQEVVEMIDSVDKVGDRMVDINQFLEMMRPRIESFDPEKCCFLGPPPLEVVLQSLDPEKPLDRKALKRVMKKLGQALAEEELDAMMEEAGVDKDGTMSFEQFKALTES